MSTNDTPEQWDRIGELFARALEVPEADREAFLREAAGGDDALIGGVRALLDADRRAEGRGFLDPPASPTPDDEAGVEPLRFGDYEIGPHLGSGAFGKVYRARQISLNRPVALKLIRLGDLADADDVRRFRTEAETVAAMDHPGIVPLYEVGEHDGQHYFSMKLIPGGNLAAHRDDYRDRPDEAARLVAEVADAVDHAHRRGVLHRDLKPANILIDESGRPIVTDFGLARRQGVATASTQGGAVGTPAYMSPEQVRGRREAITTATDIYGLGAILYVLLTGRPPFQAEGDFEVLRRVVEDDPTPPRTLVPGVSRDLEAICLKCLDKDPQRRYASAEALAADLRSAARGEPISARLPGLRSRMRRLVRTRRKLVIAASLLAVSLPAVGVIGWLVRRDEIARRQRRDLEIQAFVREASLDMEQGRWSSAVDRLERAIAAGHPQPARLRVDQARATFVLNRKNVGDVLRRARSDPDASRVESELLLWEGDLTLGRDNPAAIETVHRAIALGIPRKADRLYAEGLIAARPAEARRLYGEALEAEKYHPRATQMLLMTDLLLGDRPAVRGRLARARVAFSEDPGFPVIEACLLALEGDRDGATRVLRDAKGLEDREAAGLLIENLHRLSREGDLDASKVFTQNFNFPDLITPLILRINTAGLVMPPSAQQGLDELTKRIIVPTIVPALKDPAKVAELDATYRDYPDGLVQFTVGILFFGTQNIAQAEGFFLRAADRPALIPVERPALYAALNCQAWAMRLDPKRTPESIAAANERAGRTAHRLWRTGPLPEMWCSTFAQTSRIANQTDLAAAAADYWEKVGGKPVDVETLRAQIHFTAGRYARSIEKARAVLRMKPDDFTAKDLLSRCKALFDEERKTVDAPS